MLIIEKISSSPWLKSALSSMEIVDRVLITTETGNIKLLIHLFLISIILFFKIREKYSIWDELCYTLPAICLTDFLFTVFSSTTRLHKVGSSRKFPGFLTISSSSSLFSGCSTLVLGGGVSVIIRTRALLWLFIHSSAMEPGHSMHKRKKKRKTSEDISLVPAQPVAHFSAFSSIEFHGSDHQPHRKQAQGSSGGGWCRENVQTGQNASITL